MTVNPIKVFARLKKEKYFEEQFYDVINSKEDYEDLHFLNDAKENRYGNSSFRFCHVFDQDVNQNQIFETAARPVVNSILQGFNGTIFAYGQTGSGKTYTMTGSTKNYEERGVIPRSLQYIFSAIEKIEEKPTLYVSYMEIYNEVCYDLLNPKDNRTVSSLEELPRVVVLEDKKGEAQLKNLSILPVTTEEDAMRLLFLGDTNRYILDLPRSATIKMALLNSFTLCDFFDSMIHIRVITETPLNEYSSRSHCIFTIYVSSRPRESMTFRHSKLNLVDLAGSERVHKSRITGTILNEAKHINLSLHFLQQVILALSESRRAHIPYRNSVMTFILKDSLAGNCLTVMLATLSAAKANILENKSLTNAQKQECERRVDQYLNNPEENFIHDLNPKMLQYCLLLLKKKMRNMMEHSKQKSVSDFGERSSYVTTDNCKNIPRHSSFASIEDEELTTREIDYYTENLSQTFKKAQIIASTIEECQSSIAYIREKLDNMSRDRHTTRRLLLAEKLEYYQQIYRTSLMELKTLKLETLQFEAGLKRAKADLMKQTSRLKRFPGTMSLEDDECNCPSLTKFRVKKPGSLPILRECRDGNFIYQNSSNSRFDTDLNSEYCCDDASHYCSANMERLRCSCVNSKQDLLSRYRHSNYFNATESDYPEYDTNYYQIVGNKITEIESSKYKCCCHEFQSQVNINRDQCRSRNILQSGRDSFFCHVHQDHLSQKMKNVSKPHNEHLREICGCCRNEKVSYIQPAFENNINDGDVSNTEIQFYTDTQIVPDKLIEDNAKPKNSCVDECQVKIVHSPICQEMFESSTSANKDEDMSSQACNLSIVDTQTKSDSIFEIFLDCDTDEFREFMKSIPLTGDMEVDKEICDFYRGKLYS